MLQARLWADSGATRVNLDLAKAWAAAGHRVQVIVLKRLDRNEAASPVPVRFLSETEQGERWPKTVARLAWACRSADIVVGGSEADRSLIYGSLAAKLARRPFIVIVHLSPAASIPIFTPPDVRRATRCAFRFCSSAVCVSADLERELIELGVPAAKVTTIRNGIDISGIQARADAARASVQQTGTPIILGVGRLAEAKGFDLLIRAHAELLARGVTCRLKVLGDGPARPSLEQLTRELGVHDTVELAGFTSDIVPHVLGASVLCLSSRTEGLPLVVLESLAMRTPVIAADCSVAIRELLRNGAIGDILPVESVDALVEAISAHLQNPTVLVAKAAAAGPHLNQYSTQRMSEDYLTWFTHLLQK